MKRLPQYSVGAVSTFYHFRRTITSEAAHEAIREFIEREPTRSRFSPPPLCMAVRRELDAFYAASDRKPYR